MNIFIFLITKMVAKYTDIGKVKLEAGFQQVPIVQNFCNFHNIVIIRQYFKVHKEKPKMFSNKHK